MSLKWPQNARKGFNSFSRTCNCYDDGVSNPQYIVPSNRQHSNFATKLFFFGGGDEVDNVMQVSDPNIYN